MTLLPTESWNVVDRPDLPEYELPALCQAPGCTERATDNHHIWRRSAQTKSWWVEVVGTFGGHFPFANRAHLCQTHHRMVTGDIGGHVARIWLSDDEAYGGEPQFFWWERGNWADGTSDEPWEQVGPLDPQPPRLSAVLDNKASSPSAPEHGAEAMQLTVDGSEVPHDHVVEEHAKGQKPKCKYCGQTIRQTRQQTGEGTGSIEKRPSAVYGIRVPKDARENGHEILKALHKEAADVLGRGDDSSWQYYSMVELLAWFVQNYDPEADAWEGEGPCPTCGREGS